MEFNKITIKIFWYHFKYQGFMIQQQRQNKKPHISFTEVMDLFTLLTQFTEWLFKFIQLGLVVVQYAMILYTAQLWQMLTQSMLWTYNRDPIPHLMHLVKGSLLWVLCRKLILLSCDLLYIVNNTQQPMGNNSVHDYIPWLQNFAHATTAVLSWHVQNL